MKKRIISLILALVMAFGLLPVTAKAELIPAGLQYEVLEDHVEITRSLVLSDHIEIPGEIEGKPVTHIRMLAFSFQNTLRSITIPETVTTIGTWAFSGCTNLSTIFFPGSPPRSIEPTAFSGVTATVCYSPDKDGLMEYDDTQDYGGELTWIPHDCTHTPDYTITVTAPTCTEQGRVAYTFACGCTNYVMDYLEPLEHNFTAGVCTRCAAPDYTPDAHLQYIIYEDHVEITGYTGNDENVLLPTEIDEKPVTVICERAFYGCGTMTDIDLPDLLRTIESEAFTACTSLTELTLPNHVYDIYDQAFADCYNLTSVFIPGSVSLLYRTAFDHCFNLTRFDVSGKNRWYFNDEHGVIFEMSPPDESTRGDLPRLFLAPGAFKGSYTIPDGTVSIGGRAFSSCQNLTDVFIPDSIAYIAEYAFASCSSLTGIAFQGDAPAFDPYVFTAVTATAYYPSGNPTWTEDVMQDYGGDITWVPYTPTPFDDIPIGSFYADAVAWAVENKITSGTTPTTFDPNGKCLRAQVVTFLHRAAGNPEPTGANNPFTDVKTSDFFYKPVLWAVEENITSGISATEFGSLQNCNRSAVVTFLWRAAGCPEPVSTANPFTDVKTTDFFYKSVLWAVENGITAGLDATHFGPTADCNRAQVVTFLYRAYN